MFHAGNSATAAAAATVIHFVATFCRAGRSAAAGRNGKVNTIAAAGGKLLFAKSCHAKGMVNVMGMDMERNRMSGQTESFEKLHHAVLLLLLPFYFASGHSIVDHDWAMPMKVCSSSNSYIHIYANRRIGTDRRATPESQEPIIMGSNKVNNIVCSLIIFIHHQGRPIKKERCGSQR